MRVIGSSRVASGGVLVIGLSTDPKPSGLAIGSRFKEVDTGREYLLTEAGWLLDLLNTANRVWDVDEMDWVAMTQPNISAGDINVDLTSTNAILDDILEVLETKYICYVDEATATIMYVGEAAPGSAVSSSVWRIKRVDTTSGIVILWADGDTLFNNRWDQRTGISYS